MEHPTQDLPDLPGCHDFAANGDFYFLTPAI